MDTIIELIRIIPKNMLSPWFIIIALVLGLICVLNKVRIDHLESRHKITIEKDMSAQNVNYREQEVIELKLQNLLMIQELKPELLNQVIQENFNLEVSIKQLTKDSNDIQINSK